MLLVQGGSDWPSSSPRSNHPTFEEPGFPRREVPDAGLPLLYRRLYGRRAADGLDDSSVARILGSHSGRELDSMSIHRDPAPARKCRDSMPSPPRNGHCPTRKAVM